MIEECQDQKVCPYCNNIFKITKNKKKKFCCITCKNKYVAREIDKSKPEKECKICKSYLKLRFFSNRIRGDVTSGYKDICKNCGKKILIAKRKSKTWKDDSKKIMLMNCKYRAKQRSLDFNIDRSDLNILDYCPVLNIKLFRSKRNNWNNSPSIDRINNNLGYVKNNVVVISKRANILKKDASSLELEKLAYFFKDLQENNIEYFI